MLVIGLVGKRGAGKDTVADFLVQNHGFVKLSFAEPLKRVCRELYCLSEEQLHERGLKETTDERWGMSPREIMQVVGTDVVRRQLGDDFWVRHLDARIRALAPGTARVVISDVRFEIEADFVRDAGGFLVRIREPHTAETSAAATRGVDRHPSETEQAGVAVHHTVFNDKKGLPPLYRSVEDLLLKLLPLRTTSP